MQSLADYLEEKSIPQKDFAALLGVDRSIVSRWCAKKVLPGLDMAYRIKRLTGGAVPFEAWVSDPELPTDRRFWVAFFAAIGLGVMDIKKLLGVDTETAWRLFSGDEIPEGLRALQLFELAPAAFQPVPQDEPTDSTGIAAGRLPAA